MDDRSYWNDYYAAREAVHYPSPFAEFCQAEYLDAGKVVLSVDYAAEEANVAEAYQNASANGYVPYVSRRPLDRLTDTPPPGLPD